MARVPLTAKRVRDFLCPSDKQQVFLWDSTTPGLAVRATIAGGKAYVFQGRYGKQTLRITIGSPDVWALGEAQIKAREFQRSIDEGIDPREAKRKAVAEVEAKLEQERAEALTMGEVWKVYTADRKSKWGERHAEDHEKLTKGPGQDKHGRPTIAGTLHEFMELRIVDVTPEVVLDWAEREESIRKTQARLGWRLMRAFFNWCMEQKEYQGLVPANPLKNRAARETLGESKAKRDVLLKEQLPAFFSAVQGLNNHVAATYILTLLLTGGRPNELLALKWEDIDYRWRSMTIRDKDESKGGEDGLRTIPLTPYVQYLLSGLPRHSEWVFASVESDNHIRSPHERLAEAAQIAGLEHITFQGLRRSFGSLSEWLRLPVGVIAQIQGHKPSGTREKHYVIRPLDMLRMHHERFEKWMLRKARIDFKPRKLSDPGL